MPIFYHATVASLFVGDTILPGRFGRHMRRFRPNGPMPTTKTIASLLWEVALETARQSVAPDMPSRLNCVFACETIDDAISFRSRFRKGDGTTILAVEPVGDVRERCHRGSFALAAPPGDPIPYVDYISERAVRYWTEPPHKHVEILVPSEVKVIGVVKERVSEARG